MRGSPFFIHLVTAMSVACLSALACSPGSSGTSTPPPPPLSCMQILQCIADCADTATACPDACITKGTPEGKTNINAFGSCVEQAQCTELTCVEDNCKASLDACVTSSAPKSGGTPLGGTAPPGSVPADLVGTWSGARSGITERLVFNADGSGNWTSSILMKSQGSCLSFNRTIRDGNIVIDAKTITLHAITVVNSVQECRPPSIDTAMQPVTETITWSRNESNPNEILIVDNECAAKYPNQENCNTAGCPIGLYCTSRLTRE